MHDGKSPSLLFRGVDSAIYQLEFTGLQLEFPYTHTHTHTWGSVCGLIMSGLVHCSAVVRMLGRGGGGGWGGGAHCVRRPEKGGVCVCSVEQTGCCDQCVCV